MGRMNMTAEERHEAASREYARSIIKSIWCGLVDAHDERIHHRRYAMISVIVPTSNRPEKLKRALQSIQNQTYKEWIAIVVNDGGVDVSEVTKMFDQVLYIELQKNQGNSAALNVGLRASRSQYIAYLDDDDWYYPNHLRTLLDAIENTGERLVYSDAHVLQDGSKPQPYLSKDYTAIFIDEKQYHAGVLCAARTKPDSRIRLCSMRAWRITWIGICGSG